LIKAFLITLIILAGTSSLALHASIEAYEFDSPAQEEAYKKLIKELRCTVCQNQDIRDSNAELAKDLRRKTYNMIKQGKDEEYILDYMSERYGDFVLYRPRLQSNTLMLWVGPFIILLIAIVVLFRFVRQRNDDTPLTSADREKAEKLLNRDDS
jgi:cytochrome c-type biogenesis protein CcmH